MSIYYFPFVFSSAETECRNVVDDISLYVQYDQSLN